MLLRPGDFVTLIPEIDKLEIWDKSRWRDASYDISVPAVVVGTIVKNDVAIVVALQTSDATIVYVVSSGGIGWTWGAWLKKI